MQISSSTTRGEAHGTAQEDEEAQGEDGTSGEADSGEADDTEAPAGAQGEDSDSGRIAAPTKPVQLGGVGCPAPACPSSGFT